MFPYPIVSSSPMTGRHEYEARSLLVSVLGLVRTLQIVVVRLAGGVPVRAHFPDGLAIGDPIISDRDLRRAVPSRITDTGTCPDGQMVEGDRGANQTPN